MGCAEEGDQEAFLISVSAQTCFLTFAPVDQRQVVADVDVAPELFRIGGPIRTAYYWLARP